VLIPVSGWQQVDKLDEEIMKRTILVTGATKGIGLATTEYLINQGHDVIGIARSTQNNFPGQLYLCDLENIEQTANTLGEIKKNHHIDGIVNNAGIAIPQPLEEIDFDSLMRVYNLNLRATVQVTQFFIEGMKNKKWGRVVNVASRAIFGVKDRTSYSAAKSALIGCTRTWAIELAAYGITVNAVAPGPVETKLFRQEHPVGSEAEQKALDSIAAGRLGKPREIASAIAFMLAEDSAFITGQTLCVDGGFF